jgi:hypothetical protein
VSSLVYVCPHATSVRMLPHVCPHTACYYIVYVSTYIYLLVLRLSAYYYMCPHT